MAQISLDVFTPTMIMFFLTVGFAALFFFPSLKFPAKNALVNFYWSGMWAFLAMIVAVSGAKETLTLAGQDVTAFSMALTTALVVTFVMFIMFGWARLALKSVSVIAKKVQS